MKPSFICTAFMYLFMAIPNFYGQTVLTGSVKSEKGESIISAKVYVMTKQDATSMLVLEKDSNTATDKDGNFRLNYKGIEPLLMIEAPGYERKKMRITTPSVNVILQATGTSILTEIKQKTTHTDGKITESFTVNGVCGMCKKRIEMAAYGISGVKLAEWSAEKQTLKLTYEGSQNLVELVKEKIAAIGHDAPPFIADKKVYDSLPKCCKYRDGIKIH